MLQKDDWKLAIEDARTRHAALINLILFNDTQAMSLLRLYITVATAASAGAAGGLSSYISAFPIAVGWGLSIATIGFLIGSVYCFLAMGSVAVNLPGRGPEFWLWAASPAVNREDAFRGYLENLETEIEKNKKTNTDAARQLGYAKAMGLASPLFSLIVGASAALLF